MAGKVIATNTPWMRQALREFEFNHPDVLATIEAAIPDGLSVSIYCIAKPRPLGAYLLGMGEPIRIEATYPTVDSACWAAVNVAKERVAA